MVKVLGHWEIGYMTPIQEQYYWSWVLREFHIQEWLMVPVSGIRHYQEGHVHLKEFKDFKEALDSCDTLQRVFLEPRTSHQNPETDWLHEFNHPEHCVYVFGSAHFNPALANVREQDSVVSVRTLDNRGSLWANQALAITLYDRMVKSWL